MSDKDFMLAMGKLLKQGKYGLYKLAVEKRRKYFENVPADNNKTLDDLPF